MYTSKLKPFSIEAAIKGGKVVTRNGYSVILTSVQIAPPFGSITGYPLYGLVYTEEQAEPKFLCWTYDGDFIVGGAESNYDLFMAVD